MTNLIRSALVSAIALFCVAPAHADQDLAGAIDARDIPALQTAAQSSDDEGRLAAAALAALRRDDRQALEGLDAATQNTALPSALRWRASMGLSGVYLRRSRFADAARAIERAVALGADAAENAQSLTFARALSQTPAMRARVTPGAIRIERDMAQLARTEISVNGVEQEAVLDTGAGYSTVTQSTAERLRLRFLDAHVTVGSATSDAVPARLAIADRLRFGESEFENVVFIVLPDEALSFANGVYRIQAIVGLPVLIELGRLEFANDNGHETLRHGPSPLAHGQDSNLMLDGVQPLVWIRVVGVDAPFLMLLDTGARASHFSRAAGESHPQLLANAETRAANMGGAGGTVTHTDAQALPAVTFQIGASSIALRDIRVMPDPSDNRDGLIGQDVMRSGAGYVIDFDAMRFEISR